MLDTHLKSMDFVQSLSNPCIYMFSDETCLIRVYVDDIVLAGQSLKRIEGMKKALSLRFDKKRYWLGKLLSWCTGLSSLQNWQCLDRSTYIHSQYLKRYGMEDTGQNSRNRQLQAAESNRREQTCGQRFVSVSCPQVYSTCPQELALT